MTQLGTRSGSQVLRTFLPQQTADLRGGIYRVTEWTSASPLTVDVETVRRRLLREIHLWELSGADGGLAADLHQKRPLDVVELDDTHGVTVERWPRVWLCRTCRRLGTSLDKPCTCGAHAWGQLHFIGFHECGAVTEPRIPRCPTHHQAKLVATTSTKTTDLAFVCPVCHRQLQKGLGFQQCPGCRQGRVHWNVHKARSAYTPRGIVLVNPPRPDKLRELLDAGGQDQALRWVVDDLRAASPLTLHGKPSRSTFVADLVGKGMEPSFVENLADQATASGQLAAAAGAGSLDRLPEARRDIAGQDALDIALALAEVRQPSTKLHTAAGTALAGRYDDAYPAALRRARLAGIDLVERFPVLNVMYGYTRGGNEAGKDRLVPFRHPKKDSYRFHGDLAETEAYLVRLDPVHVADWLHSRGHRLDSWVPGDTDPTTARLAIVAASDIPLPGDSPAITTVGSDLLTLVHTYSHRMLRQTSAFAGIDRDALSEYLVPVHLGFFLYAAPRGEFVLGGLQAVFESELDTLLNAVVDAERRCPLDPGCSRGGGTCSACLHIGESSCRAYNTYLDRRSLFGEAGFMTRPI